MTSPMHEHLSDQGLNVNQAAFNSSPPPQLPPNISLASLDVVPLISHLLSRLKESPASALDTPGLNSSGTPTQTSPTSQSATQSASQTVSQDLNGNKADPLWETHDITLKEFVRYGDLVKSGLTKVRGQILALPDVRRSVEEQRKEIAALEDSVRAREAALADLRDWGLEYQASQTRTSVDQNLNMAATSDT